MAQRAEHADAGLVGFEERRIIERPRLTALLDGADSRLILLIGPAGYGKTTLAREWTAQRRRQGLWYRARFGASDVAITARNISQALTPLSPTIARSIRELLSALRTPEDEPDAIADLLLEELGEWPPDAWFVIDEYELIAAHPGPARIVERLVADSGANVLITSRDRPTWVRPRDLLYGDAFEVRAAALSMTLEEASQVLENARPAAAGLVALADGWPAVIGLAALLPREVNPTSDAQSAIFDYVAQELFDELAPDVQRHLVLLSVPATLTPSLVHSVTGDAADRVLRESTRVGLMTAPEPNELEIHPLCRAFLERKLWDIGVSKEEMDALAAILIDAGRWDDAFAAIQSFSLDERLPLLIEHSLRPLLAEGRLAVVEDWATWADRRRIVSPEIALAHAETYLRRGSWTLSESLALTSTRAGTSSDLRAQGYLCAGSAAHLLDEVDRAWSHYGHAIAPHVPADIRRRALWGRFALSYWTKLPDYQRALIDLEEAIDPSPEHLLRLRQAGLVVAFRDGNLDRAVDAAVAAEPLLRHIEDPLVRCSFLSSLTYALGVAAHYAEAETTAKRNIDEASRFRVAFVLPTALVNFAMAKVGRGQYTAAAALVEQSERDDTTRDSFLVLQRRIVHACIGLSRQRPEMALSILADLEVGDARIDVVGEAIATRALAEACSGHVEKALKDLEIAAGLVSDIRGRVMLSCTNAVLSLNEKPAIVCSELDRLAGTITTTGCFDTLICAMRAAPPLLSHASQHSAMNRVLVVAATRTGDRALAAATGKPVVRKVAEKPLSNRELEVLQMAGEGFHNEEIDHRLFISPKTVKTHLRNIYAKLDVSSRTEAAMKAKEMGLLS